MSTVSSGSGLVEEPSQDAAQSLAERMRAVRDQKESATSEDFPIPGWSDLAWVRLKVIGHKEQRRCVERNRRVRDRAMMDLYVAADTLIAATDGFYEVKAAQDEDEEHHEVTTSWLELGKGVMAMGQDTTPRQALIRLIGSERVVMFYGQYIEWLNGEREQTAEEQKGDFQQTP